VLFGVSIKDLFRISNAYNNEKVEVVRQFQSKSEKKFKLLYFQNNKSDQHEIEGDT